MKFSAWDWCWSIFSKSFFDICVVGRVRNGPLVIVFAIRALGLDFEFEEISLGDDYLR